MAKIVTSAAQSYLGSVLTRSTPIYLRLVVREVFMLYILTLLCPNTLFQHEDIICKNLEFEMFSIFLFLKVLYFF